MPASYPDQQRTARDTLKKVFANATTARIIHYSCESFDDRLDGRSPRITSIAIRRLASSDTESFSIHRVAERRSIPLAQIEPYYNELEKQMLSDFYEYVKTGGEITYLHWNMRDANYGFDAIAHRFTVLGGEPQKIPDSSRVDLSPLLQQIYGSEYIEHPRLKALAIRNGITMERFLGGADEARAFDNREYVALHQSTLRKVDILNTLAELAYRGALKTNASWWDLHGGSVRGLWMWIVDNKTAAFCIGTISLVLTIYAIFLVFHPIPTH